MPDLLDQLRDQRTAARTAADEILTRAAAEQRDLTAEELAGYQARVVEQRTAEDAIDAERDRQVAELRAASTRAPGRDVPGRRYSPANSRCTTTWPPGAGSTQPSSS